MEPSLSSSPLTHLKWLLEAKSTLSALADSDDYTFYEMMHRQAALLAPVDACYVCLYRSDGTLFFSYNFDEDTYDEPLTVPIGNGPTSWVIRHGLPFILTTDNKEEHDSHINFGDGKRVSQSAVHLPLVEQTRSENQELLGVFSVQSYQEQVYDESIVMTLQLWCDDITRHMLDRRQKRAHNIELQRLQAQLRDAQAHQIRMSDHFVELLQPTTHDARELSKLLKRNPPVERTQLRAHAEALCRSCYRMQTEVSQLPLSPQPFSQTNALLPTIIEHNILHNLDVDELETLRYLTMGVSNAQIAEAIGRSMSTVKKRCRAIFSKLNVRNRTEAARIYTQYAATTKNIQWGNQNSP